MNAIALTISLNSKYANALAISVLWEVMKCRREELSCRKVGQGIVKPNLESEMKPVITAAKMSGGELYVSPAIKGCATWNTFKFSCKFFI